MLPSVDCFDELSQLRKKYQSIVLFYQSYNVCNSVQIIRKLHFSFFRPELINWYSFLQGIPTLIIAVSGIDDAASVAIHGIIQSIMFFPNAILWYQILQGPIAIVGGLGFGVLWGWLAKYVPEKGDVSNLILARSFF